MHVHAVNLIPEADVDRRPSRPSPVPSVVVSAALVTITLLAFPPIAAPAPRVVQAATVTRQPARIEVTTNDPIQPAVERAYAWAPWEELLADIARNWGDRCAITMLRYEGSTRTFHLQGSVERANDLPRLMIQLERINWIEKPEILRAVRDEKRAVTEFAIDVKVVPPFRRKDPKP